ncbi:MAG: ABC transporter ATP-binding protein [Cyanobacteria bacterium]|nr:ABC transporter ATP-binding protein [Cyanobacteriota bacterium]
MEEPIIRVSNLGKKYNLGTSRLPQARLGEILIDTLMGPIRRMRGQTEANPEDQTFWALQDLSFEVNQGETVAIIGRNGAGKSTLFKILARITPPTEGYIDMIGRTGAILEVGVGFHGELTGRENIYLNGAVLGMKRKEIKRKFDEIVAFAEIEQFLDTPIKRYSSGMYVRLAFAVAAYLEPDILIVDEVLAVGDMQFQQKCLGKMNDVARDGRTVLFVSHNLAAVRQLCARAIVLSHGKLIADDRIEKAIDVYLADSKKVEDSERQWGDPPESAKVWPVSLQMLDESEQRKTSFASHQSLLLDLSLDVYKPVTCQIVFTIVNSQLVAVFSTEATPQPTLYQPGRYRMRVRLPASFLTPDLYRIDLRIHNGLVHTYFQEDHALSPVIEDTSDSTSRSMGLRRGVIFVDLPWEIDVRTSE